MGVSYNADVDNIGGGLGGVGGLGGGNSLLWLLLLGQNGGLFGGQNLKQDTAAAYQQGEQQSKIDALGVGQNSLAEQIRATNDNARFEGINGQLVNLAGIQRDSTTAVQSSINDLSRQNAECCCELKAGQESIRTAIAMQTNELNRVACENTQRILDAQTQQLIEGKNDRIRELENQAQTGAVIAGQQNQTAQLQAAIAALGNGNHGGGNPHDLAALVGALKAS